MTVQRNLRADHYTNIVQKMLKITWDRFKMKAKVENCARGVNYYSETEKDWNPGNDRNFSVYL